MKKFLIAAFILASVTAFATGPNEKILEAFEKTFTHAQDVKWHEVDNNFEASFKQNEIMLKVQYDLEGNIKKSIRYYHGNNLPIFIQGKIQKKFKDKNIFGVTEITSQNEVTYHIILEDEQNWVHLKSDAYGSITVDKKFKKA